VGFTGTGGAGKSTLVDELVCRFRREFPRRSVAIVSVDPTRRRSGGALLGDRLRMNALKHPHVFVRSLATRQAHLALSNAVGDSVRVIQAAGFDLIFIETAGIGQSDSEIVDLADLSVYVMTPEYGASSQLEKIDMIDLADLVVLNKFDRWGGRTRCATSASNGVATATSLRSEPSRFPSIQPSRAIGTTSGSTRSIRP
jgi:methylmalonyl-CoA mutase